MERMPIRDSKSVDRQRAAQKKSTAQAQDSKLANQINNSPAMVAQRQRLDGLFGGAIQRVEEEEPVQGKFESAQRKEDEKTLQGKFAVASPAQLKEREAKPNNTGLPDKLRSAPPQSPVIQRIITYNGRPQTYDRLQEWYSRQVDTLFLTCPPLLLESIVNSPTVTLQIENFIKHETPGTAFVNALRKLKSELNVEQATHGVLTHPEIGRHVLSFMPISTLANLRGVNQYLRELVDTQLVFRLRFFDRNYTIGVTFGDVSNYFKGYEQRGLHGTSLADTQSLYSGLKERKQDSEKVYKTSQLGPGFYLTEGSGNTEWQYAKSVADERKKMTNTSAVVLRVFISVKEEIPSIEVPKKMWADMEQDIVPDELQELCEEPKLLTSAIVQNEHIRQIKINPELFDLVRILPPTGMMDTEFYTWVTSYLSENPFEFGTISYN